MCSALVPPAWFLGAKPSQGSLSLLPLLLVNFCNPIFLRISSSKLPFKGQVQRCVRTMLNPLPWGNVMIPPVSLKSLYPFPLGQWQLLSLSTTTPQLIFNHCIYFTTKSIYVIQRHGLQGSLCGQCFCLCFYPYRYAIVWPLHGYLLINMTVVLWGMVSSWWKR